MTADNAFRIPLMAGFECSTHRRSDGFRVDILEATAHGKHAMSDYALLKPLGINTVREGLRWHVIEPERGKRDWSSLYALADAARVSSTEIIWDLLHFGFPDWVNPFHPDFPSIFADFAADFASRNTSRGLYVPVNEISFLAWAAGDVEYMHPWSRGRGGDLKRALCAASIQAIGAIRAEDPEAMIMAVDPMIAVHHDPWRNDRQEAATLHKAQFEAIDMLLGRRWPELGGHAGLIDIIGVNHYPQSQWVIGQGAVDWKSPRWRAPSDLMRRIYARYGKPVLLAETGCEGDDRPLWFDHITKECRIAAAAGVPIMGICLYPIISHIAWTGERHCPNGLFDGPPAARSADRSLLDAINRYRAVA